ncbi:hypothetical protein CBR_g4430 [Chara braunii]|uniref:Uncharacterized protein n=1 Tax=Chara braunii TaxID=69332 RepID=A0A388KHR2_CHABU|nr:hypothetical protein CBR_g4430 [Chara braunii]|eukprot:GBG69600.1 hypothetical protein CBR_g4430 [Chara braunii]
MAAQALSYRSALRSPSTCVAAPCATSTSEESSNSYLHHSAQAGGRSAGRTRRWAAYLGGLGCKVQQQGKAGSTGGNGSGGEPSFFALNHSCCRKQRRRGPTSASSSISYNRAAGGREGKKNGGGAGGAQSWRLAQRGGAERSGARRGSSSCACSGGGGGGRSYAARRSSAMPSSSAALCAAMGGGGGGGGVIEDRDEVGAAFPSAMMVPTCARGYGSFSGATLERSKLDLSKPEIRSTPQTEDGGGGGDIGKKNFNGGGDGGDDGGDDDDYFDDFDDGDDGDDKGVFSRRAAIPELFDKATINAVLQEWFKTMRDLPLGLRQAVEMGLASSVQITRFMSFSARPTIARAVSRMTPLSVSRGLIGRMVADPGYLQKLAFEQGMTIVLNLLWEIQHRGAKIKEEWDLAAMNIMAAIVCNGAVVWALAPSRSFGTLARYDWQNVLQKLPNHVFDKSYPLREFSRGSRVASFFVKMVELGAVGMAVGAVSSAAGSGLVELKRRRRRAAAAGGGGGGGGGGEEEVKLSVPVPSIATGATGYGAFLGISSNLRYQLINGIDRGMGQSFNNLSFVILCTLALRGANTWLGEPSRRQWLGMDVEPAFTLQQVRAYRRPSALGGGGGAKQTRAGKDKGSGSRAGGAKGSSSGSGSLGFLPSFQWPQPLRHAFSAAREEEALAPARGEREMVGTGGTATAARAPSRTRSSGAGSGQQQKRQPQRTVKKRKQ